MNPQNSKDVVFTKIEPIRVGVADSLFISDEIEGVAARYEYDRRCAS